MKTISTTNYYELLTKVRKISFVVLIAISVFCAWLMVPNFRMPITSVIISPNDFAQLSDSSWIPMIAAICSGIFLPLVGVIYCKNSLTEDLQNGIFQLERISPIKNHTLILCKFLTNLEIMITVLAIIMLGSYSMICVVFTPNSISTNAFFSPFVAIIPGLVFASATAVFLDCIAIRFPKGGSSWGVLLFLAFYIYILTVSITRQGNLGGILDFTGLEWLVDSINQTTTSLCGNSSEITILAGGDAIQNSASLPTLVFQGLIFSQKYLWEKIILCLISMGIIFMAMNILPNYKPESVYIIKKEHNTSKHKALHKFKHKKQTYSYPKILKTQQLLLFRNIPTIWRIILVCLWLLCIACSLKTAQDLMLPILFGWSFILFSRIGCQEYQSRMLSQLYCIRNAMVRQAIWSVGIGIIFSILLVLPIIIRCCLSGELQCAISALVFALFIPALSLFFGDLTQGSRLSEILILILCFLMLNEPSLVIGISPEYFSANRTAGIFFISLGFIISVIVKRNFQIHLRKYHM